jgi:hypothetical protein
MTYRITQKTHNAAWAGYFSSRDLASPGEIDQNLRSQGGIFNFEIEELTQYIPTETYIPLLTRCTNTDFFYIEFDTQENMLEFILRWS